MKSQAGRLVGVDAARGVALFGMMAIHVLPGIDPDGTRALSHSLAHGRSAAAFALLAGVSLGLVTRRVRMGEQTWASAAAAVFARALVIGAIGLTVGYLDSGVAVILAYYAVFFVLMIPLIGLPTRALVVVAVLAGTVVPVLSQLLRAGMAEPDRTNPTFEMLVERPGPLLEELLLTGYYPGLVWLAYLATGMVVSRLRLRSPATIGWLVLAGLALTALGRGGSWLLLNTTDGREQLAAAAGLDPSSMAFDQLLFSSQFGTTPTTTWWWLAVDAPHTSTPFDMASTTGTALLLLGVALAAAELGTRTGAWWAVSWWLAPLAAVGSMTLTLYTAHVVALAWAPLPADELSSYLVQVVLALLLAVIWRSLFRRGPLETVTAGVSTVARRPFVSGERD